MAADVIERFWFGVMQTLPLGMILYPIITLADAIWQAFKSGITGGDNDKEERKDN